MPKETSFAVLYKKLLDCNFDPDPDRAGDALRAILRQLSSSVPPKTGRSSPGPPGDSP